MAAAHTSAPSLVTVSVEASEQAMVKTWCLTLMSSAMTAEPIPPDPAVTKMPTVGRAEHPPRCLWSATRVQWKA